MQQKYVSFPHTSISIFYFSLSFLSKTIMSVVGEAALTAFFDGLFGKLSSSDFLDFVTDKQVFEEINKWEKMLRDIRAVLDDAEGKQMKDQYVKNWLADLQDLAYDVDDILDEFATEALGRKLTSLEEPQGIKNKVQKIIPTRFSPKTFMFNKKMVSKIKEISARINDLATKRTQLELRGINEGSRSDRMIQRLQPTSLVDETQVYGRQEEKAALLELLLSNDGTDNEASVIPIIGMGGIGKTTLAQLLYNDTRIENSFEYKAWVCVSEDFDAVGITKRILRSITPGCCTDDNDLNLLQVELKKMLAGKKLLLVLDDIWNDNYLELTNLLSPFGVGTKILVTTRSHDVSSIMGTVEAYPLQQLSEEDCLSVFSQHALRANDFSGHPELKEVGEIIVKKCNGLPLAAKAIGGLLRTRLDYEAWKGISESEIWGIPEEKCSIIPALRLSYHHLPSHLKRCFGYCSILHKDYEFGEEEIILLWKAEGFLQPASPGTQLEVLGSQYFRDLVSRSFFQTSTRNKSRFVMHDLVNDLAQAVAREICSKLENDKQLRFSEGTRHSSYVCGEFDGMKKFEAFNRTKHLRTFLPLSGSSWACEGNCYLSNNVLVDLLPKLRCLRVLSLKGYHIIELPNFFQNLIHLRYLDFSHTRITSLPDSTCTLYNLETLLLYGCRLLQNLPSNLQILVNLHVLDITDTSSMKGMPFGIGNLTNLQRLSDFVLGKGDGYHIQEMKNLLNLKGKLCISGLENIVNAQDAWEAKLIYKSGLGALELKWSREFDNNRNKEVEEEVLNLLEPHKKLEELFIQDYGGTKFPIWMNFSLQNLSSLVLKGCKNCVSLPSLGKLPLLKKLSIVGMDELNKVGIEFYGENQSNAFASLQSLSFEHMPRWKEWDLVDEQGVKFPSLVELCISDCPQLLGTLPNRLHSLKKLAIRFCRQLVVSLSNLPKLSKLQICECAELVLRDDADFLSIKEVRLSNIGKFSTPTERLVSTSTTLKHCDLPDCEGLTYLSLKMLGLLGSVRKLEIFECPQLVLLEPDEVEEAEEELFQVGNLCNIESLRIWEAGVQMDSLRIRKHFLPFLTEMEIEDCPNIVCFAKNNLPPLLKKLEIANCKNLRCLVDEGENISITNISLLEHLNIIRCPSLISLSLPVKLRRLYLRGCLKLASLSESGKLPIGLKGLYLSFCPELESIAEVIDENACLESISFCNCGIKSLPQGLDKLNHLRSIEINRCSNLVSLEGFLPTTNLTNLWISECENLRALPNCMPNLTSLRELTVWNKSGDQISIPEEGISANLTSLKISVPRNYESLIKWGLHRLTSLKTLDISGRGCPNMVAFPPEEIGMMLPPALMKLSIKNFKNLKCLSSKGFRNLTSLHHLSISSCPKLTFLPEKDMLLSLLKLCIGDCPLLEEKCKRGKGREWSKIAHLPCIKIDV
ncbi:PREDICTED: putative disease resistance RPP13-like protein 1 [Theobroma cacao]|uniref:Disease resistance RPP13-like protein 1 n=1 Tax=Theobroma cacao TaxID=3641 RepID=A0AB32WNP9_THECC|nr:PREDICTED: putative disease resistance RPP13-like protein 1 [Theobroma cacao]XP_017980272.1 PREDICTED: putative disease resistance RPP13-like protein 1 [Theobroma cacao]XP_017980273.1 PREDICTED: putative disease resistance RPP13-like protein 1 [Theobroma cacao]XP_017980274.1 PREDICTED: putative disease resistance RPP13-like protein 1 [Theobroma cacao]XP_017980275.1 PREDICTED: putative disease resistance RPP13-like protein 1 [Theobroma cacao]XP_017980276.1 PREDICTED: putative disease resista